MLGPTVLSVSLLYGTMLLVGFYLAKRGRLDVAELARNQRLFTDPLTRRFQLWLQREKMNAIRQRQWFRLGLLILANNFAAVAVVGRTLYGIAIVPAAYFTYRQGINQGAVLAHLLMRPRSVILVVMILEFGAYLLATALGVNLVVTPLAGGSFTSALRSLVFFYPVVGGALIVAAWVEVHASARECPPASSCRRIWTGKNCGRRLWI